MTATFVVNLFLVLGISGKNVSINLNKPQGSIIYLTSPPPKKKIAPMDVRRSYSYRTFRFYNLIKITKLNASLSLFCSL